MGLQEPKYGHHIEDITEYIDGEHGDRLQRLIDWVEESKEEELTGFIGGPPCPDFSVAGKIEDVMEKMVAIWNVCATNLYSTPGFFPF